jgi:hypothetical protein
MALPERLRAMAAVAAVAAAVLRVSGDRTQK